MAAAQQMAEPVAADQMAEPVAAKQMADSFTANQMADPVAADKMANPVAADQMADPVATDQMADPVAAKQIAGPVAFKQMADPVVAKQMTDIMGIIAVLLILLLHDPPRGESEGHEHMQAQTYGVSVCGYKSPVPDPSVPYPDLSEPRYQYCGSEIIFVGSGSDFSAGLRINHAKNMRDR